ncbi:MAG TPA: phage portal protein [Methylosinus sp.]|jgi:hypothetical protein|uniref:phage portal protein n=1 Tax=Methylosinus sp. TaxID=427 RepID=UPI002F95BF0F
MAWRWPWQKVEKRSASSGFTAEIIGARASYIAGPAGIGELTAAAQSCVSLWENGFAIADIDGTALLDRRALALIGRSLALRGEAVFLIRDRLVPCADWDLRTRNGSPTAYRVSISEAGGGTTQTALAGEVLHFRIGADAATPWLGASPLRRSALTASLLQSLESALGEVYENAPLGSQIVPFPESSDVDLETIGRGFRARRGRVLLRESVNVSAAGGPAPAADWKPQDVTPDLSRAMTAETLAAARAAICRAFGVLPGLFYQQAQGPLVREAQRHLAAWTLQPIAELIAEEATAKLGAAIKMDVLRPTQAFDSGGAARALGALVSAMAEAKAAGLPPEVLAGAFRRLDWET